MSYLDRLKPSAYISPLGQRQEFKYSEALTRSFSHKLDSYNYAELDGTFYQDLGITGFSYPVRFHFSGNNYDLEATQFEFLLSQRGYGTLEHPVHGTITVVVGSVRRSDSPVKEGGFAPFDVEFFEAIPQPIQKEPFNTALGLNAIEELNISLGTLIEDNIDISENTRNANYQDVILSNIDSASTNLTKTVSGNDDLALTFSSGINDINDNISTLVDDQSSLTIQIAGIIQLASFSDSSLQEKFTAYTNLINKYIKLQGIVGSETNPVKTEFSDQVLNIILHDDMYNAEAFIISAFIANINSAQLNTYEFRTEALNTINFLKSQFDLITELLDTIMTRFDSTIFFDQYFSQSETYAKIRDYLFLVIADIQRRALDLKIEKIFTLEKDTHYLKICAEKYNSIEADILEFFEKTNNIHGDEFFLLKKGRQVKIYN